MNQEGDRSSLPLIRTPSSSRQEESKLAGSNSRSKSWYGENVSNAGSTCRPGCSFESTSIMSESPLELFRRACGLSKPLSLECEPLGQPDVDPAQYCFDGPFVLIGRDPRSDLVLNDPQVSRRHAFFQAIAGRVFCIDLESRAK